MVVAAAGCTSVTLWFAPNTTCADWKVLAEDQRTAVAEQVVGGSSLYEGVRRAQHAPVGTPNGQLVAMAASSVTKNCDLQRWDPKLLVKDLVRELYAPEATSR